MTDEKETSKPKMKLFDYIFESSIKSSKTILNIVNELILLSQDVRSLRDTILTLSKVLQTHQAIIEDICKVLESAAEHVEKQEQKLENSFSVSLTKDPKKDKPN
ncbi:MAG: hypothetical protein EBU90_29005 [Proteobacteria bacterium]|jgi:hypothetical protein|nr:hypothetical protein [Pseudomonadota bacterium]